MLQLLRFQSFGDRIGMSTYPVHVASHLVLFIWSWKPGHPARCLFYPEHQRDLLLQFIDTEHSASLRSITANLNESINPSFNCNWPDLRGASFLHHVYSHANPACTFFLLQLRGSPNLGWSRSMFCLTFWEYSLKLSGYNLVLHVKWTLIFELCVVSVDPRTDTKKACF